MVSSESLEIKTLETEDITMATQIAELLNTHPDDGSKRTIQQTPEEVLEGVGGNVTWFVAEIEGRVRGCLRVERRKPKAFYLSHLKVEEDHRHHGLGRSMVETAELMIQEIAQKSRASVLAWFDVLKASKHVEWYKRRDFKIKEERAKTYQMGKRIRP